MSTKKETIDLMSKSIKCLALELPELVWDDVAAKWGAVLNLITPLKINHDDPSTFPSETSLLLTTSRVWRIGDWYDGIWRVDGQTYWDGKTLKSKLQKEDIIYWLPLLNTENL